MLQTIGRHYEPDGELTEEQVESGLKNLIRSGVATQAFVTFTCGTFLVAFALKLGASNFTIGLLAAIAPLAQFLNVPSIYLVEKVRRRRLISVSLTGFTRLLWLPIALLPFFFSPRLALVFLVALVGSQSAFGALSGASWNSWMRDLVPAERLGRFFSYRMMISSLVGAALSILSGLFIDFWDVRFPKNPTEVYSLLFLLGVLAGMIGTYFLDSVPEPAMPPRGEENFPKLLAEPFRHKNFRSLIVYLGFWNFATNLAAPFLTVYMLKALQLPMSLVVILGTVSQVANLITLQRWGHISDKFSNKTTLQVASPIFLFCYLGWCYTVPPAQRPSTIILLFALHVLMGISTAGITIAGGNIGLKLAPRGQAGTYMGAVSATNAIAAGIAPIIGGRFADFFTGSRLSLTMHWISGKTPEVKFDAFSLQGWDFFFFFAFLIGLLSLHRLSFVEEHGEVKEHVVVNEIISQLRREMRNLSTVGGLRKMISFPANLMTEFKKSLLSIL